MSQISLTIIFSILMLAGVAGVILPMLPGIPFMFLLALIFGFIDSFVHLTSTELIILGVIATASFGVDYLAGLLGARIGGASPCSILAGIAGLTLGLFFFPPFGSIIGLFLGVLIAEIVAHNNKEKAVKAATGGLLGTFGGIVINILLSLLFLGLFIYFSLA